MERNKTEFPELFLNNNELCTTRLNEVIIKRKQYLNRITRNRIGIIMDKEEV